MTPSFSSMAKSGFFIGCECPDRSMRFVRRVIWGRSSGQSHGSADKLTFTFLFLLTPATLSPPMMMLIGSAFFFTRRREDMRLAVPMLL